MTRTCLLWTAIVLLLATRLPGQSLPDVDPFFHGTLQEALDKSLKTHRMLLVYPRPRGGGPDYDLMDKNTWQNPTLNCYILWHAIAVKVDQAEDPEGYSRVVHGLQQAGPAKIYIFIDGRLERTIPDGRFDSDDLLVPVKPISPDYVTEDSIRYLKPLRILFSLDFMMDGLVTKNPVWYEFHKRDCPEPPTPPRIYYHDTDDATADAVADPDPSSPASVLDRLDEARESVEQGGLIRATGLYTWLVERGDAYDPAFRAARRTFVAAEVRELTDRGSGMRERMIQVHDELGKRWPWFSWGDTLDWMRLNTVLDREQLTLLYHIRETVDPLESVLLTPSQNSAYRLMEHTDHWSDPGEPPDAIAWAGVQVSRLKAPKPLGSLTSDWDRVQAFRREVVIDELSRAYAAALIHDDSSSAELASRTLLRALDDADSRLSLVVTALVAHQARPEQRRWLQEAAKLGRERPDLMVRLDEALGTLHTP